MCSLRYLVCAQQDLLLQQALFDLMSLYEAEPGSESLKLKSISRGWPGRSQSLLGLSGCFENDLKMNLLKTIVAGEAIFQLLPKIGH